MVFAVLRAVTLGLVMRTVEMTWGQGTPSSKSTELLKAHVSIGKSSINWPFSSIVHSKLANYHDYPRGALHGES